ncbi:MAG: hypothetical protein R3Y24_15295 [Eubacteriales bacterium]
MVRGVDKFKTYFKEYTGQYTFIGGAACDIILGNLGESFRATKDLDMVLLLEELSEDFVNVFIQFVEDGGYEHIDKGTGENQFFRFSKPKDNTFPYMIELFSKRPDYLNSFVTRLGPIHISDDAISLSAILLDDEYYRILKEGVIDIEGVSVLDLEHIILFKIKAWLDLSERKEKGEVIDSKNIKKHKNDIFRLSASIEKESRIQVTGNVRRDTELFLSKSKEKPINSGDLGIKNATFDELLDVIESCYL